MSVCIFPIIILNQGLQKCSLEQLRQTPLPYCSSEDSARAPVSAIPRLLQDAAEKSLCIYQFKWGLTIGCPGSLTYYFARKQTSCFC